MPNRIIREGFITSKRINACSDAAQNLFIRLMLVADDYGRYHGITELVKSHCYPFDSKSLVVVSALLTELIKNKLITYYMHGEDKYIEINNFGQRLRQMRSKYPDPPSFDSGLLTVDSIVRPETKRNETENETENETNSACGDENQTAFDSFRKKYPGTKRGNPTEYDNFIKKHRDWKMVLPLLEQIITESINHRKKMSAAGMFVPEWKNLQTWINNRCWEEELPAIEHKTEPKHKDGASWMTH